MPEIKKALWLLMLSFSILAIPIFSEYLKSNNFLEVLPSELALPLQLTLVLAIVVALLTYFSGRIFKLNFPTSCLAIIIFSILLVNFEKSYQQFGSFITTKLWINGLGDGGMLGLFFASALLGSLITAFTALFWAKPTSDIFRRLPVFMTVATLFVFLSQITPVLVLLPEVVTQASFKPTPSIEAKNFNGDLPDIYYIVLDRYTNSLVLKEQFGFDNSNLVDELRGQGFVVDENSYANYPYTSSSVASTLNATYLTQPSENYSTDNTQTILPYFQTAYYGNIPRVLTEMGYQYYVVGSWYATSSRAPLADTVDSPYFAVELLGRERVLKGLEVSYFKSSPYYPLQLAGLRVANKPLLEGLYERGSYDQTLHQLDVLHNFAESKRKGGRFIFAHILTPHNPYVFSSDGSPSAYIESDNVGLPIQEKYTDQLSYISGELLELTKKISEHSSNSAVIAVVSDEGPNPAQLSDKPQPDRVREISMTDDMTMWSEEWLKLKFGNLYALKIPQADNNVLSATPGNVNVFRLILNHKLGYNLPLLPNCHFALPGGKVRNHVYQEVGATLKGLSDESCEIFH